MRLQALDDAHLVTRAQAGSVAAFEELVRRHRDRAFRVALRMVGDPREAEDITQDALVAAWRSLDGFRADSAFTTWLHRIVLNRCLNALRARRETEPLPDDRASVRPSTERTVEARIQLEDVRQAILHLTPEQRGPLVLRELEGCSYEELADSLEISVSAVKSRLHRARLELLNAVRGVAVMAARWPNPLPCGQWMAGLIAQVADGEPADVDHQATCEHCQGALAVLDELWIAVDVLAREQIETPSGLDRAVLRRIRRDMFVTEAAQLFGGILPRLTRALLVYGGLLSGDAQS